MSPDKISSDKKTPPKPLPFGQPEKPNWVTRGLIIGFLVLAVGGMIWMIKNDSGEKRLTCHSNVASSLTGFGSCSEE
jgi:hypothetical protein